jgi:aspartyl/asparaginyl beta-hydroxylase (cupin superfamily)
MLKVVNGKVTCEICGCKHFRITIYNPKYESAGIQCVDCENVLQDISAKFQKENVDEQKINRF